MQSQVSLRNRVEKMNVTSGAQFGEERCVTTERTAVKQATLLLVNFVSILFWKLFPLNFFKK